MLRVTVELIGASTGTRKVLGICHIANDGKATTLFSPDRGDYDATFSKWAPKQNEVWRRGRVTGFDRVRRGAWDLLYLALRSAVGDRNQE